MKLLPRLVLFGVLGLVALLILGLLGLMLFIDPIVERALEKEGTEALGAPLLLSSAKLRLRGGLQFDRLVVLNPEGSPRQEDLGEAFRVERVVARTRLTAVLSDPVEIAELVIVQPEFSFVFGKGGSNWGALMRNLSSRIPPEGSPDRSPEARRFLIRRTKIVRPVLHFRGPLLQQGLTLRLKDIELDRIGNLPDSPAPLYLVLAALLQGLLTGALEDEGFPGAVSSTLGGELEEAVKGFGGLLRAPE
jgi:hypothetical protein